MYIIKNAWRAITRSKGRNILIGIIILVIALSSCIALSIREAAEKARADALEDLSITAQIGMDRGSMMKGKPDQSSMKEALTNMKELTLDELKTYAESSYVKDFYYTISTSLDGSGINAVDMTGASDSDSSSVMNGQAGGGDGRGRMGTQGDFTLTGYSSDSAMADFSDGTSSITSGKMFPEGDSSGKCIISSDLATYNNLAVGSTITLTNPNKTTETYTLTVSGIYETATDGDSANSMMGGFSPAMDAANRIYTSYENVKAITDKSSASATTSTDSTTGMTTSTAVQSQTTGNYAIGDMDSYNAFKSETEEKLGDGYTVSSTDLTQYEQSLEPLTSLSTTATWFLLIILIIGAIILVVLNMFTIRERKYEIGVLAAIGMKKQKIAAQFLSELVIVAGIAILLGAAGGAIASVPVTNALLAQQTVSSQSSHDNNFDRSDMMSEGKQGEAPSDSGNFNEEAPEFPGAADAIQSVSSATDLVVIAELIGIGIVLTIVAGSAAIVAILRYDPLMILSDRD